jgi:hypothetical protein
MFVALPAAGFRAFARELGVSRDAAARLELLKAADRLGLEGVVRDAPYRSGKQCDWVKVKCATWREANKDGGDCSSATANSLCGLSGLNHFILELLNRADAETNHLGDSVDADSLGKRGSCLAQLLWIGIRTGIWNMSLPADVVVSMFC